MHTNCFILQYFCDKTFKKYIASFDLSRNSYCNTIAQSSFKMPTLITVALHLFSIVQLV